METKSLKHWLPFMLFLFFSTIVVNSQTLYKNSSIVGTWVSEDDSNWKLIFTADNKCYQYYSNSLTETDSFIISNTSPQCGVRVPIDNYTSYLQLINTQNAETICYEINGITDKNLSLRVIDNGGAIVFVKQ